MNISILLISIYIFLDNLGYSIYEFKKKNITGGISVIFLNLLMLISVNYFMFNFK